MCDPLHCGACRVIALKNWCGYRGCLYSSPHLPAALCRDRMMCPLSDLFETCACRRGIGVQDYCSGWRMLTFQVIVQYTKQYSSSGRRAVMHSRHRRSSSEAVAQLLIRWEPLKLYRWICPCHLKTEATTILSGNYKM
jgi:hypothetical protein